MFLAVLLVGCSDVSTPSSTTEGLSSPTATQKPSPTASPTATQKPTLAHSPTATPTWTAITSPQIYNGNVFVLPVAEDLVSRAWDLPMAEYTERFYEHFNDEFDFLVFIGNVRGERLREAGIVHGAQYTDIRNDVQGIGKSIFADGQMWGNTKELQGLVYINTYDHEWGGDFSNGVLLHELMHRWANFVIPPYPHWGFKSADCMLDRYDISSMKDHGGGTYSVDFAVPSFQRYCPIELYLAGLIPPQDVPDFRIAVDGEWSFDEAGNVIEDDNGYRVFTASEIKTYEIDDIVAAHGARIPDASQAQKDFRAAVVLLIGKDYPAPPRILDALSQDVAWFSHPGDSEHRSSLPFSNFYQAAGGKGTIAMGELPRFQKNAQ